MKGKVVHVQREREGRHKGQLCAKRKERERNAPKGEERGKGLGFSFRKASTQGRGKRFIQGKKEGGITSTFMWTDFGDNEDVEILGELAND